MGLFDGWQFDPGRYVPQQGAKGLLDALMTQAAGPLQMPYDQVGMPSIGMPSYTPGQTQYQPQYIGPNPQQPLAPLPAPINVGVNPAQNPGTIPELPRPQNDATYPPNAQPAQYHAAPQAPQEVGLGDRLLAGLQGFTNAGGPLQAIGDMVGGFANGATRENMTEQALVRAGIDPGMAKTIVKDRGMLAAVLPSILGSNLKPTFGIIGEDEFGKKTYGWIDPKNRSVTDASGAPVGQATASGGGASAPGALNIPPPPPGADPKEWRRKFTDAAVDAATGKKTEVQQKAAQFAGRMEVAEKNIRGIEEEGTGIGGTWGGLTDYLPNAISGHLQPEKYQKFSQAKSQFITALLRQESGAAISATEFARYDKELFPQPGDTKALIEQKREVRRVAMDEMRKGAGPGSQQPVTSGGPSGVSSVGVKWSVVPQ